jgi:hypothetical protein
VLPWLLLCLLSPCLLTARAHSDGPICTDDTAVPTSNPLYCCPSVEYALLMDPRGAGSGPLCTRCRFDRNWCDDAAGGCCHADDECAMDARGLPVCVGRDDAGVAGRRANRSSTDFHRDRVPSGTSAQRGSPVVYLFMGLLCVVTGGVLLCVCWDSISCARTAQQADAIAEADKQTWTSSGGTHSNAASEVELEREPLCAASSEDVRLQLSDAATHSSLERG